LIQLTVHVPLILVSGIRHLDGAPHLRLAFPAANEQSDQADGVQTVGLGTPGAPIHLDTRRVDDHTVDTLVMQEAMEPEAIASGLVAGEDRCALG
jgi:hypothetical protein